MRTWNIFQGFEIINPFSGEEKAKEQHLIKPTGLSLTLQKSQCP